VALLVREKVDLDKVTHSVRAAQAVLQYGVGAMVDFPDQTLVTAAPETWNKTQRIYDERFAKALGVDYFALPIEISYSRFPTWYFCPKCRRFQSLEKWIAEYQSHSRAARLRKDPYMTKHMQCVECSQDLVVARIVTACEEGHINDFPWVKWVHVRSKRRICHQPTLSFKTGASGTEGLEGLSIACSCGAYTNLSGAFEIDCFEKLDLDADTPMFLCEGGHPHKNVQEKCSHHPRTLQRGSSSVYFPVVYSSLVIPPYADEMNKRIEQSRTFLECQSTLNKLPEMRQVILENHFPLWLRDISLEVGALSKDVETVLKRKWFADKSPSTEVTAVKYRAEEYEALSGELGLPSGTFGDFSRVGIDKELFQDKLPHIKAISLIDKVRVVSALVGFSRINPVSGKADGLVSVKEEATSWYPAYEVRGEGIFVEFEQSHIDDWIMANPEVVERAQKMNDNYNRSFLAKNNPRIITPKFVLLHTISHLLIAQLSFECGYSIASLSERLYCAEEEDGKQMAAIFIYTASGDSEGTLGGLVRQGEPDALPRVFRKAIVKSRVCSQDPVCILSQGQGRESLNLAACYACALLPETCCEERNSFLDRGLVVGTFDNPKLGFYHNL
jgi:hypothetical protein